MGTNYYWYPKPKCECCEREYSRILIGHAGSGWHFKLCVFKIDEVPNDIIKYVKIDIQNIDDWKHALKNNGKIINEYGGNVSYDQMFKIITQRSGKVTPEIFESIKYSNPCAMLGINGLLRRSIDDVFCVGHGEGTWDYIKGEFS